MPSTVTDPPTVDLNDAQAALQVAESRAEAAAEDLESARTEIAAQDAALDAGDRTITPADIRMVANRCRAAEAADQAARQALASAEADAAFAQIAADDAQLLTEAADLEVERQAVQPALVDYRRSAERLRGITFDPDRPIRPAAVAARELRDEWQRLHGNLYDRVARFNAEVEKLHDRAKAAGIPRVRVRPAARPERDVAALQLADMALARAEGRSEMVALGAVPRSAVEAVQAEAQARARDHATLLAEAVTWKGIS